MNKYKIPPELLILSGGVGARFRSLFHDLREPVVLAV